MWNAFARDPGERLPVWVNTNLDGPMVWFSIRRLLVCSVAVCDTSVLANRTTPSLLHVVILCLFFFNVLMTVFSGLKNQQSSTHTVFYVGRGTISMGECVRGDGQREFEPVLVRCIQGNGKIKFGIPAVVVPTFHVYPGSKRQSTVSLVMLYLWIILQRDAHVALSLLGWIPWEISADISKCPLQRHRHRDF